MNYFTVEQEQQKMFTQLPKALLYEDKYKLMSNDSKLLYSFLVDRVSLSLKNGYVDDLGRVYIKCSEITMGEILNKSEKTVRRFKKELIEKDLLEQADAKNDKTKYYVKQPQVTVEKLEDYIADFQQVVKEKAQKEVERNKEYRLKKANNKVALLKAQLCYGNNDRSIENTGFEDENMLNPLETLATVETTVMHQSKLPYSNNDFSNTDYLGMYVCTGEPAYEEKSEFLLLAKKHNIIFTREMEEIVLSYEEVFSYDLYEYLFLDILNKYRNGRVHNFEKYLLRALDGQSSRQQFTLSEYLDYKVDFGNSNYQRKDYVNPYANRKPQQPKKPETKEEPKTPEQPKFVPSFVEPTKPAEELPTFKPASDLSERLKYRQENNLMDNKYSNHSLKQLKEIVADRNNRMLLVEQQMEKYNKDMFDEETRRRFAMHELGLC